MGSVTNEREQSRALVPIAEAMPELRAEQYAKVREWHVDRMALVGEYQAADGEYLKKIRDALVPKKGDPDRSKKNGLWTRYLQACGIPYPTAIERIRKAEGRFVASPRVRPTVTIGLNAPATQPEPTLDMVMIPTGEYQELKRRERLGEFYATEHGYLPRPHNEPELPPPLRALPVTPAPQAHEHSVPSVTTYSVEAWAELHPDARLSVIYEGREGKAGLNKQTSDNVEWARWTWNPVTGCLHDCPYCYARDIANRFYPQKFVPTFHPFRLGAPLQQAVPAEAQDELGWRNIFTCSMADLFGKWVPSEWIQAVLDVVADAPQWNFLFLTKFPNRLAEFEFPDNAWPGTSVDCQARVKNAERAFAKVRGGVKWLSIEPMLEPLHFDSLSMFNWVVIGGASASTETPEWHPPRRWVDDLESQARAAGCMVYEKTNLQARLREYPGWQRAEPTLPEALRYLPSIGQLETEGED